MILIRADANGTIGSGHVMRCLSIAKAFTDHGEQVCFVTADNRGDDLINSRGFSSINLCSEWTCMEDELPDLIRVLNDLKPRLLLIDSYYVTEEYFHRLSSIVKTAYIDDLNQAVWDVDYLINYNVFATVYDYSSYADKRTILMLNPKYAPLREEFRGLPKHIIKETVTDILVSAGGADPEGISERLISGVCPAFKEVKFHFIVGALNPRIEELKELQGDNIILHINERNMSGLMRKCDIAVSAAGTTLYELCAAGIPTITYSLADNQCLATEQFDTQKIMFSVGDCRGDARFFDRIKERLEFLIENRRFREDVSFRMQELVDGYGADRLIDTISETN